MVIGSRAGLVSEEDRSSGPCGLSADRRVFLFFPPPDAFRILLVGAHQGPLRRKPEPGKQFAEPLQRVGNSEFAPDKVPDDLTRPQRIIELKLPRVPPDNPLAKPGHLLSVQLRRRTRRFLDRKCRHAPGIIISKPAIDSGPATVICDSGILGMNAILNRCDNLPAGFLKGASRESFSGFPGHKSIIPDIYLNVYRSPVVKFLTSSDRINDFAI